MVRDVIFYPLRVGEIAEQPRAEILDRRVVIYIPQSRRPVIAGSDKGPAIRREYHSLNTCCMSNQAAQLLPRLYIP